MGGSFNGINIPTNHPLVGTSITLTKDTVTFTENGRGLVPSQYTDFINSIMSALLLKSYIETTATEAIEANPNNSNNNHPFWNLMNYCNADTFFLVFQESGLLVEGQGQQNMLTAYGFESYNGLSGINLYGAGFETPTEIRDFLLNCKVGSASFFVGQL